MAHIDDGGGDRRSSSVDVNLVPFIDLMSVLIIFLLITAVWTQVSMIQIGSSVYGKRTEQEIVQPPPRAEVPLRLDVKALGYQIIIGKRKMTIPKVDGVFNRVQLLDELKKVKDLYPEKIDVVITMADALAYEHLIDGMDALLSSGFPEISIATGGVQ